MDALVKGPRRAIPRLIDAMVSTLSVDLAGARSRHNEIRNRLRQTHEEIAELPAPEPIKSPALDIYTCSIICVILLSEAF